MYFYTIHSNYEADIILSNSMGSIAKLYFHFSIFICYKKRVKNIKATGHCVEDRMRHKWRFCLYFFVLNTFRHKTRMNVIFGLFACKLTLHDFTCTSRFHNKGLNLSYDSDTCLSSQMNKLLSYIMSFETQKITKFEKRVNNDSLHVMYYKVGPPKNPDMIR